MSVLDILQGCNYWHVWASLTLRAIRRGLKTQHTMGKTRQASPIHEAEPRPKQSDAETTRVNRAWSRAQKPQRRCLTATPNQPLSSCFRSHLVITAPPPPAATVASELSLLSHKTHIPDLQGPLGPTVFSANRDLNQPALFEGQRGKGQKKGPSTPFLPPRRSADRLQRSVHVSACRPLTGRSAARPGWPDWLVGR